MVGLEYYNMFAMQYKLYEHAFLLIWEHTYACMHINCINMCLHANISVFKMLRLIYYIFHMFQINFLVSCVIPPV